jgi:hypothetical protein
MLCLNLLELALEGGFTRYACPVPRLHCSPSQERAGQLKIDYAPLPKLPSEHPSLSAYIPRFSSIRPLHGCENKEIYLYFLGREIVDMPVELALSAFRICLQPVSHANISARMVSSVALIWGAYFIPQYCHSAQHHLLSLLISPII